ncbi:DNA-binding protein RHL1 isoform X2 [Mercurialis annua]|nr:DNA-binding protein RHL1 isoform X2 [Mercurialis annua]
MVRPSSKNTNKITEEPPAAIERKRLKKLAFSNNLLSSTPPPLHTYSPLPPTKALLKHHGADILRKSQRKNRFLFSFPGLIAPIASGGKIGELKDLGTKNPILYLHFPLGQLKLFGTITYPKNRYLSLQFSRGGKNVVCEDYFDNMIVFSEAWWIGTQEENPEEVRLDFPKQFLEVQGQQDVYDFKGGAGASAVVSATVNKQVVHRSGKKYVEEESPETELEDNSSDDKNDPKETKPVRHSERTSTKTFKFADVSSGEDSVDGDTDDITMEGEEEKKVKTITSSTIVLDFDDENSTEENHESAKVDIKSEKLNEPVVSAKTSKGDSNSNHGSLVQATISTLFKKVNDKKKGEEKNEPNNSRKSLSSKVSGQKLQPGRKKDQVREPLKRGKLAEGRKTG